MRTVYVNDRFLAENNASISIFDRGFLFADAVYEVTTVLDGKLIDFHRHMSRLRRSLAQLKFTIAQSDDDLLGIHRELVARNDLVEGLVYLQVSRGVADRDFLISDATMHPSLVLFTQAKALVDTTTAKRGQRIVTVPDLRWRRCDIKTVQLLYASLAKTDAVRQGADDVWMVLDGKITEGSSNNAYIVTGDGTIVTRALGNDILHGITREAVLSCAQHLQLKVEERSFSVDEARAAREAFSTSATGFVNPVVQIDESVLGDGTPGPVTSSLRTFYVEAAHRHSI